MAWRKTKNGNYSKIQHCKDCGVRLEPDFIDGNDPENWFWPECSGQEVLNHAGCWQPVCKDCSEEINKDGWRACNECLIEMAQIEILRGETK